MTATRAVPDTTWELLAIRRDGSLLCHIARGKDAGDYTLRVTGRPVPGCLNVVIHKAPGEGYHPEERRCYQVETAEDTGVCTCWGWLRWKPKHCKHIDCVLGLIEAGLFDTPLVLTEDVAGVMLAGC